MSLTKDTEKAFKIIYCEYKRLRKTGAPKKDAMKFKEGTINQISAFSDWLPSDIDTAVEELVFNRFIKKDVVGSTSITEEGIAYMENKPKEFFKELSGIFDIFSLFV